MGAENGGGEACGRLLANFFFLFTGFEADTLPFLFSVNYLKISYVDLLLNNFDLFLRLFLETAPNA